MQRLKNWIEAFRLRTLFLALASVITGGLLPVREGLFRPLVFILTLITTVFLQILSNLANDYGDSEKGTDNENRVGPLRSVQSGKITHQKMKRMIIAFVLLSLISGLLLLYISFPEEKFPELVMFFFLGIAAIWAAIKYTVGKGAFGYSGLGDFFVFIFFGLVGVAGSYYVQTLMLDIRIFLPALTLGLFSVGVLNLNNMRDIENDKIHRKHTIPVRLGLKRAKNYHISLITLGWLSAVLYLSLSYCSVFNLIFLLAMPLFVVHLQKVIKREGASLDPLLRELSLSTFLFSVLFAVSFLIC
ncbi:1,4-dihydroxy-2-naphthoate polyprenyltransferase [Saccharicrinis sp. FJH62]|uniref:1,4-dihydroxy-2-naphthoate polyprenyltransferase n=1 Tax=Saccharicrinis sp. FJH62 TaxID=3344657 RepID=UPI0035D4C793